MAVSNDGDAQVKKACCGRQQYMEFYLNWCELEIKNYMIYYKHFKVLLSEHSLRDW